MKAFIPVVLAILLPAAASDAEPAIPYFKEVRDVSISAPEQQNYIIVDAAIWNHARPDLADLRLYDGTTPVEISRTPEQGYHFMEDMTDKAIQWLRYSKSVAPQKPVLLYFAPGAAH